MPAIKMKSRSTSKSTSARTTRTSKPAASRTRAKTTTRRTVKQTDKTPQTEATNGNGTRERALRAPEGMSLSDLKKLIKQAERLATNREKQRKAWDDAVEEAHMLAVEMLEAGVSMAVVSRSTGISRQWLYKILENKGNAKPAAKAKSNGRAKASAKKTTTRSTAAKKTASKPASRSKATTTRSRGSKPAAKKSAGRIRIKAR